MLSSVFMTKYHCIPIYWKKNYYASSPIWDPFYFQPLNQLGFFFWLCYTAYGILVPSTRDWTHSSCTGKHSLNLWISREFLSPDILALSLFCCCSLFLKKMCFQFATLLKDILYSKHATFLSHLWNRNNKPLHTSVSGRMIAFWCQVCLISEFSCDTQGMTIK